jgi:hypothetical protein
VYSEFVEKEAVI